MMSLEESAKLFELCRLHYSLRELCFAAKGSRVKDSPASLSTKNVARQSRK